MNLRLKIRQFLCRHSWSYSDPVWDNGDFLVQLCYRCGATRQLQIRHHLGSETIEYEGDMPNAKATAVALALYHDAHQAAGSGPPIDPEAKGDTLGPSPLPNAPAPASDSRGSSPDANAGGAEP